MTSTDVLTTILRDARVVPVVRAPDADRALSIVGTLLDAGLRVVELTTTVPGWADVLGAARERHPDAIIGMGTVLDEDAARRACAGGADFLVTPLPVPAAYDVADEWDVAVVGGAQTPAEIHAAASRGIAKLFPAHVGGVTYLRSLLAILPDARIVPTGGIGVGDVAAWLDAGALAVGVGSDLYNAPDPRAKVEALVAGLPGSSR